jgi:hypothetical protein
MLSVMKIIFLFQSFILFVFFSSCDNVQVKKPSDEYISKKSDSVKSLHNAIYLSDKYEKAAVDSLKKYHLTEIADSCLKFIYVVNYKKKFNDDLWCKHNSLTIGESEIKVTGFVNKGVDQKLILFGAFLNDSIPCSIDLITSGGEIPIGFTVDVKKIRVINVMVGQYTAMDFSNFKMYYDSIVSSTDFKSYLNSKSGNIHPTFKRLLFL